MSPFSHLHIYISDFLQGGRGFTLVFLAGFMKEKKLQPLSEKSPSSVEVVMVMLD